MRYIIIIMLMMFVVGCESAASKARRAGIAAQYEERERLYREKSDRAISKSLFENMIIDIEQEWLKENEDD